MTATSVDPPVRRLTVPLVKQLPLRYLGVFVVVALLTTELVLGWSSLTAALHQLRRPHLAWLALATVAELAAMSAYARMQRHLLRSAGIRASRSEHVRLAYAAHSLNETLPGGPAFSTRLNYQEMRRFGASPAVASWAIALSGILSASALAAITVGSALGAGGATHWRHLAALLLAAVLLLLGVHRVARRPESVESLIRSPLAAFNRLRRRPAAEGRERILDFLGQLRAARLHPAHGLAAAALAVLNWLLDAVCLWLCFRAAGEQPAGMWPVLLAFCAGMAAGSVTIVPGGLGIVDSALILGLVAGGTAVPAAVATVVLYRLISAGFVLGLGWLAWLRIRRLAAAQPTGPVRPAAARTPCCRPIKKALRTTTWVPDLVPSASAHQWRIPAHPTARAIRSTHHRHPDRGRPAVPAAQRRPGGRAH